MQRENFNDLLAFIVVAKECNFTRAAAKLGVSQSALSHTVRGLESRLNIRLLTRTTRSVSPTEAGERLLRTIGPHFEEIEAQLVALNELRDKPTGTIRINAPGHAANTILYPKLMEFLPNYPDINVEVAIDDKMIDIVKQQYDAGVRLGEQVANDMIAMPIGPEMRMVVVGSPSYFKKYSPPKIPQDLTSHNCINLRLPTYDTLYAWEFEKDGYELKVHVKGQLIFSQTDQRLNAALAGLGLAYIPDNMLQPYLSTGELISVLDDWSPFFPGYYLYYPNRRQASPAFKLLLEALRYRP